LRLFGRRKYAHLGQRSKRVEVSANWRYPREPEATRRGQFGIAPRARKLLGQGTSNQVAAAGLLAARDLFLKVAESSFERSTVMRMRCGCKLLLDTGARKLKALSLALPLLLFG